MMSIIRIAPLHYIHVLNNNDNITRLEVGPQTFVAKDQENVLHPSPQKMIRVPPQHYCEILNPVVRDPDTGAVTFDSYGTVCLAYGDSEIRFTQDPFPLYPGETLKQDVTPQTVVAANSGLLLRAEFNGIKDEAGAVRNAGDEWLFEGPAIYRPQKGVRVRKNVDAEVILPGLALRLRARKEFTDKRGVRRVTGEEWLIKDAGSYLPDAYEEVVKHVSAFVLTEKKALHLKALRTFTDDFKVTRKNGEEWLVTMADTETHIPHVYEQVISEVPITTLTNRQYAVLLNPVDPATGKPQLGQKRLVKGERSFFLRPGEQLESGIQSIYVLSENEGLILKANEEFAEADKKRQPGDCWMIRGPAEIIPPIEVEVVCKRVAIAMDKNEGIYVRDISTGGVRAVTGQTYMLTETEELWEKHLPETVETLLSSVADPLSERGRYNAERSSSAGKARDKTRVVTLRVPHNAAVQVYDFKNKTARVVFGPDLVMLGPDEHFTQLSLSGGKPKKPNVIKSLCLLLGPDFCTDIVIVETSDHARLSLQLSYNWHFKVEKRDHDEGAKLFSVPDFVGDCCKAIASRVRGLVASVQFDDFHKNSARIIRSSVFGLGENGKVRDHFIFKENNLVITSIDIQSVEPVDQRTREALQKSVQLAIEITTKSQEATARQEAERLEQEARGRLERQMIDDEAAAEVSRKHLLELKASSAAVESTGQAKAEAQSMAERAKIEGEAAVEKAKLRAEADTIEAENELSRVKAVREAELAYLEKQHELEVSRRQRLSEIEVRRYERMLAAMGTDTLRSIAAAGPELDVRLLKSLGLQTTMITDGHTPLNLFNTAHGLIGRALGATGEGMHLSENVDLESER